MGTQVPIEMQFRHLGKPKGMCESAVGLVELGQGFVFCKLFAPMSLLPERRGCSQGIRRGGRACPSPPSLCSEGVWQEGCTGGKLPSPFPPAAGGQQEELGTGRKVLAGLGVYGAMQLWDVLV